MTVDRTLEIRPFLGLGDKSLNHNLRTFYNNFCLQFGLHDDVVEADAVWKQRLNIQLTGNMNISYQRRTLFAFEDENPVGIYQFSMNKMKAEGYGEGVYIKPEYRGRRIALDLFGEVIDRLSDCKKEIFYVGYHNKNRCSGSIRRSKVAQGLAEGIVKKMNGAVVEAVRARDGKLMRYAVDVEKAREVLNGSF